jgi:DNA-directed RNA polymerase subunit RPC12/RpoP
MAKSGAKTQQGGIGQCPRCHGKFIFNQETAEIKCAYCGYVFTLSEVDKSTVESARPGENIFNSIEVLPENLRAALELPEVKEYKCSTCGALVTLPGTSANTMCNYCRNQLTATSDKLLRPDGIVPFKITAENARKSFEEFLTRHKLVDKKVFNLSLIDKLEPAYVPYYAQDMDLKARLKLQRTTSRHTTRSGNYDYYEDSVHERDYEVAVLVNDSEFLALQNELPGELIAMISPFDLTKVVPFDEEMLANIRTEHRNVELQALENLQAGEKQLAVKKLMELATTNYAKTLTGKVEVKAVEADYSEPVQAYILLPIWIVTLKDKDDLYYFIINGQTGETYGRLKVAWSKIPVIFALASLGLAVLIVAATLLMEGL